MCDPVGLPRLNRTLQKLAAGVPSELGAAGANLAAAVRSGYRESGIVLSKHSEEGEPVMVHVRTTAFCLNIPLKTSIASEEFLNFLAEQGFEKYLKNKERHERLETNLGQMLGAREDQREFREMRVLDSALDMRVLDTAPDRKQPLERTQSSGSNHNPLAMNSNLIPVWGGAHQAD